MFRFGVAPNITEFVLPFPSFSSGKSDSINFRNREKLQIHLFFKNEAKSIGRWIFRNASPFSFTPSNHNRFI